MDKVREIKKCACGRTKVMDGASWGSGPRYICQVCDRDPSDLQVLTGEMPGNTGELMDAARDASAHLSDN